MADVTISNLNLGIPSITDVIPYSTGSNTNKATISSLKSVLGAGIGVVDQAVYTGQTTNGTSTFTDTGLTITVNRSTTSSIFLVFINCNFGSTSQDSEWRLVKNGTAVPNFTFGLERTSGTCNATEDIETGNSIYLDNSPLNGSNTYKIQFRALAGNVYINRNGDGSTVAGSSQLTVVEILK